MENAVPFQQDRPGRLQSPDTRAAAAIRGDKPLKSEQNEPKGRFPGLGARDIHPPFQRRVLQARVLIS